MCVCVCVCVSVYMHFDSPSYCSLVHKSMVGI